MSSLNLPQMRQVV